MSVTPDDLRAWRVEAEAATPGPWSKRVLKLLAEIERLRRDLEVAQGSRPEDADWAGEIDLMRQTSDNWRNRALRAEMEVERLEWEKEALAGAIEVARCGYPNLKDMPTFAKALALLEGGERSE